MRGIDKVLIQRLVHIMIDFGMLFVNDIHAGSVEHQVEPCVETMRQAKRTRAIFLCQIRTLIANRGR